MPVISISLVVLSVTFLFLGVPIAVSLGLASTLAILYYQPVPSNLLIPQLFSEASTSFVMLAVPLFILAGNLMEKGTVGRNLIDFTTSIVGWATGGLGNVNIVGSMIFGGISGSSLADTATFGTILIPRMEEDGYPRDYAAAVTMTSSCLSVIIPPSILLILGAAATQQSVAKALAAGLVPGVLVTVLLMVPNYLISKKRGYGTNIPFSVANVLAKMSTCWTAIVAPLIILGTIFTGIVSPTEGAAVAVAYVLVIDCLVFRRVGAGDVVDALRKSATLTSAILFIATSSAVVGFIISFEHVPDAIAQLVRDMPGGRTGFLILINVVILLIGMVLDAGPALLVFLPLFMPIAVTVGIDPIHFLTVIVMGLALGLTTPPYGVCLFSVASISGVPLSRLVRAAVPFYAMLFIAMVAVTFVPQLAIALPAALGL